MNQQDKLKVCAEALGWEFESENEDGVFMHRGEGKIYMFLGEFTTELVTKLGIATWQDKEGVWYASLNYEMNNGFYGNPSIRKAIWCRNNYYHHKDYSQAVFDCVAGEKL